MRRTAVDHRLLEAVARTSCGRNGFAVLVHVGVLLLTTAGSPTAASPESSVTSTILTTSTYTCVALAECTRTSWCAECLAAVRKVGFHSIDDLSYAVTLAPQERATFQALVATPACYPVNTSSATLFYNAISELSMDETMVRQQCVAEFGLVFYMCMEPSYHCFLDPSCRSCLSALYTRNTSVTEILQSSMCSSVSADIMLDLAMNCGDSFPVCSWRKIQCSTNEDCRRCLAILRGGDGVRAAQECSKGMSAIALDNLVDVCAANENDSCGFWRQRCEDDATCSRCLAAVGVGLSPRELALAALSNACAGIMASATSTGSTSSAIFNQVIFSCPPTVYGSCQRTVLSCALLAGTFWSMQCSFCILGNASEPGSCELLLNASNYNVYGACAPCSSSVFIINRIVMATTIVGTASVVVCLWVVATILAYRRDLTSMRDRIIIALMFSNAVYSSASAIPLNALQTGAATCGQAWLSFSTKRFGRAWWFAGKYALVGFELLIIGASAWVLAYGNRALQPRNEAALHVACTLLGVSAFVAFYLLCRQINESGFNADFQMVAVSNSYNHVSDTDDANDGQPDIAAYSAFSSGRHAYDTLVRDMLVVWDGIVGFAIAMWLCLLLCYRRVVRKCRELANAIADAEAADVWVATRQSEWQAARRVLELQRRAYEEVAKPLELYVLVFIVFGAPAIIMSTTSCQNASDAQADTTARGISMGGANLSYGTCDVWCEFLLAFRSLGAVGVFLLSRERRTEIADAHATCKLLYVRVANFFAAIRHVAFQPVTTISLRGTPTLEDEAHSSVDTNATADTIDPSWFIRENDLSLGTVLGEGAFATVYKAEWKGNLVAVKILSGGLLDADGDVIDMAAESDFVKECNVLSKLCHPNLLRYFGCGISHSGCFFIVTEFMPMGALRTVLSDSTRRLPWRSRVSIALQVATGMAHLHGIPMVHRDLKSANVLIDGLGRAAVGDFGSSRRLRPRPPHVIASSFTGFASIVSYRPVVEIGDTVAVAAANLFEAGDLDVRSTMTKSVGTLLWMAPEVFRGDNAYGPPVDVYSFGIVLWELATRALPWSELDSSHDECKFFLELSRALQTGRRPAIPDVLDVDQPDFVEVMRWCWCGDPADRPTFARVVTKLALCLRKISAKAIADDVEPAFAISSAF